MQDVAPCPTAFRFGDFELDSTGVELRRYDVPIHVQPQPLKILLVLVRNHNRVVTRAELEQQIWCDDTYVGFEDGVNHAISKLRDVLGDSIRNPQFIATVPRLGYRFLLPVEEVMPGPPGYAVDRPPLPPTVNQSVWQTYRLPAWLICFVVIVVVAALLFAWMKHSAHVTPVCSVAVLPFRDISADQEEGRLADTMTNALIARLSEHAELKVAPHASVMRFAGANKSVSEIGRELKVDHVIEGSVQHSDRRLRVAIKITRTDERNIWAEVLDLNENDLFALEDSLSTHIMSELLAEARHSRK